MGQIRFEIKIQDDEFYNVLKERVQTFIKSQPNGKYGTFTYYLKCSLFIFSYFALYFLIVHNFFTGLWILLGYALFAFIGLLVAFNVSHDATHQTFSENKALNKFIYYLTFNLLGPNAYLWGIRHNSSHHIFPNVDGCDADIDSNYIIRLSPNRPLLPHHKYQWLYAPLVYLFYTLHWVFIKDFQYLTRKNIANLNNIKHPTHEVFAFFLFKIFHLFYMILVPIFWFSLNPVYVILGFFTFHFTLSYIFLFTNIMNHHSVEAAFPRQNPDGTLPGSWARHQMDTCLDFYPESHFWNFFFGGFNSHCAHHLFPGINHVHYIEISKIISRTAKEFHIEHKVTTWEHGIVSHFRHLKDLGSVEPDFIPV